MLGVALFVVVLGAPDGAVGVVWPSLRATLDRPVGDLGLLPLIATAPYLVGSSTAGPAGRRFDAGHHIAAAAVVGALGIAAWAAAPAWWIVLAAFAMQGWACGSLDAALNAQVAAEHGIARLGLLHATYGVGATGGPVLATAVLVLGGSWRIPVGVMAVLAAAAATTAVLLRNTWPAVHAAPSPRHDDHDHDDHAHDERRTGTLFDPIVLTTLALFFVYVALEGSIAVWAFTFLTRVRDMGDGAAGTWTAVYWGALTAGRFVLAAVGNRLDPNRLLGAATAVAAVGTLVFWADVGGTGVVGLPIVGLALAPIFPVLIGVTPRRVGEDRSATVIGWSVAAAAAGGPIGVALLGQVGQRNGFAHLAPAFVATAVAVAAVNAAATRLARANANAGQPPPR